MFSDLSWLRSILPTSLFALRFLAVTFKLAYRELHERRGKTVRCAAALRIACFLARSSSSDLSRLHSVYFFAQGMCLYLLRSGFSAGLRLAKTTELRTTLCNARSTRLFCRFLAPSLLVLRPLAVAFSLFFCTRHVPIPVEVGFLGRSSPRQDNGAAHDSL